MSIVGTRPPLISETNLYEPRHKARLAIKPGITGMWQVSGRSDITDFEEVVRLDKEYIENWDIGLDIKILLKTVMVVAKKDGSIHKILFKTIYRKKDGHWRAEYLKKHRVFHAMGDNCYFEPTYLPADACLISIGNNVRIAANVSFVTHDIFGQMFWGRI